MSTVRRLCSLLTATLLVACAAPSGPYPTFRGLPAATEVAVIQAYSPRTGTLDDVPVTIHRAPSPRAHRPALIYLGHCDGELKISDATILADLLERGVTVAQVESLRGTNRPSSVCADSFSRLLAATRIEEAYKARELLVARGLATRENVAIMGTSHGGRAVSEVVFDQKASVPFKAALAIYPHCQTLDVPDFRLQVPTLILMGSRDDWTPAQRCVELQRRVLGPVSFTLRLFEGAYHSYDHDAPARQVPTGTPKGFAFLQFDRAATVETHRLSREFFIRELGL
ncbi:MAG: prolyl oligopeptidase family serine peptidase [Rubrivivax sp.]|nr:prolyl oligopeptidase family serine peptidase [Rubrivivax sp.]